MLGETLCRLRKKQGLTQQEVADKLEVTRQTVSNWECDQGAPTLDKAKQLAQLFHVSLDDFVNNDVEFEIKKGKDISFMLLNMVGKTCKIYYDAMQTNDYTDVLSHDTLYHVVDVNEDWVKVEYKRAKEFAILKKETVIKYIDLSSVNGFCIMKEEN